MATKKALVATDQARTIDDADSLLVGTGIDRSAAGTLTVGASTATLVTVQGVTVGRGPGAVSTNTVVGTGAGSTITTGSNLTCVGSSAVPSAAAATNEATIGSGILTFRFNNPSNTAPNGGITATQITTLPSWNVGHTIPAANAAFATFLIGGVVNGGIRQAAGGGGPLVYATTSDYRVKTDVQPIADPLARLDALKPCRFRFTTNPTGPLVDGFIAHEVQAVVPQAVVGEKDAVDADGKPDYQGMDQAHLVPVLTAACQELAAKAQAAEARAAAAEARLTALEAAVAALQAG